MSLKTLFTAAIITLAMATSAFAAEPIKIGVYLPLTGQNAFGGQLELEGVQLAHKEMSKVLDRDVELVIVDNKSDKAEAATAVTRLTAKDQVTGIIGT
ncbi:ABC transporter substrate-binding protein, partial [Desulfovibrio sp. OttesenSCG-928-G15]|nr:ABC transporter substrate-binding protein [Desulfovibrio sp. OttesenSCG-928-G15]